MSDLITDEMVEAAARAYHEAAPEAVAGSWDVSTPRIHERGLARARAALEAAAPLIAATALRDAADAWQWGGWSTITEPAKRPEQVPRVLGIADAVTGWIRARADQSEKEDT